MLYQLKGYKHLLQGCTIYSSTYLLPTPRPLLYSSPTTTLLPNPSSGCEEHKTIFFSDNIHLYIELQRQEKMFCLPPYSVGRFLLLDSSWSARSA